MLAPLLGLLAGVQHALTGPDHMAGVAPLAAGRGRSAWRVGVRWGLGHVAGASCAALAALALRGQVPGIVERLAGASELVVGIALLLIGGLGLRAAIGRRMSEDSHRHGSLVHRHWHDRASHDRASPDRASHAHASRADASEAHRHAAFWLGALHGAAGLSHLFAVLPALAFPGWWQPLAYLAGYGGGSLAAIAGFTAVLGRLLPGGSPRALRLSLGTASAVSVIVGATWITRAL